MSVNKYNLGTPLIFLHKKGKTSNASNKIIILKSILPLQIKYTKLLFKKKWSAGRSRSGRITVFSKGPKKKLCLPFTNYSYRSLALYFIAGINYTNTNAQLKSLLFNSTGSVSYIPFSLNDTLFKLSRLPQINSAYSSNFREVLMFKPYIHISTKPFLLIQQSKNTPISFLEIKPLVGITYVRSLGSKALLMKLDTRIGLGLVKLPSGVKKVFSAFSLATKGCANLPILKNKLFNTKSGSFRKKGLKSTVRGVAMNPIDHPHGGRTKAIKYPRTPWGKTTKFK